MSNGQDQKLLQSAEWQKQVGGSIAECRGGLLQQAVRCRDNALNGGQLTIHSRGIALPLENNKAITIASASPLTVRSKHDS